MSWEDFYGTVRKTVGVAADRINHTADLAALQVKLSLQERRVEEAYAALGRASYDYFLNESDRTDTIEKAMEAVDAANKKAEALRAQMAKMRAESRSGSES